MEAPMNELVAELSRKTNHRESTNQTNCKQSIKHSSLYKLILITILIQKTISSSECKSLLDEAPSSGPWIPIRGHITSQQAQDAMKTSETLSSIIKLNSQPERIQIQIQHPTIEQVSPNTTNEPINELPVSEGTHVSSCEQTSGQVREKCESLKSEGEQLLELAASTMSNSRRNLGPSEEEVQELAAIHRQQRARRRQMIEASEADEGESDDTRPFRDQPDRNSHPQAYDQYPGNGSNGLERQESNNRQQPGQEMARGEEDGSEPTGPQSGDSDLPPQPYDEAAERREQEAAEASEAEAANKSALDEQQQAQREIIMAQAQSEARAIKQQQEALMMQQKLQQQMLLKRQNELMREDSKPKEKRVKQSSLKDKRMRHFNELSQQQQHHQQPEIYEDEQQPQSQAQQYQKVRGNYLNVAATKDRRITNQDIQFSDQASYNRRSNDNSPEADSIMENNAANSNYAGDEQTQAENPMPSRAWKHQHQAKQAQQIRNDDDNYGQISDSSIDQALSFIDPNTSVRMNATKDLLPSAQHHYGSHFGSLHGHQKDYYQFAESHKKGQFDSGFKRGGKKFHISGHSSQHKSHAEGHVKWHGKKGKGSHYWDLKHKGKKHGYGYH